jgi:SAM-dependent methyltransferase
MASVEENIAVWDQDYDWNQGGEEWSESWGNSEMQWHGCLLPRIHSFVPARRILEIAPGFGRWTRFLKDSCESLTVVDVSEKCVQHCRRRFADRSHIDYVVNDGKSLEMIPERSVDFVCSFDSLVHAPPEVLEAYLAQLATRLSPDGVGFIHHSNAGHYATYFSLVKRLPRGRRWLSNLGILNHDHWRDLEMTAERFSQYCSRVGLSCISQELLNWGGRFLIDSFSVFTLKGSRWDRPHRMLANRDFMRAADHLRQIADLYTNGSDTCSRTTSATER